MKRQNNSIVALDSFIQSTRDSGYKSTPSAIAELVDNAIQAGATEVKISIHEPEPDNEGLIVAISDNGSGMDKSTLVQAMRFGGSSRYNSRSGLGRFGMGLPNASLSQSKRVEVYTWQHGAKPTRTHLDVDEIARGDIQTVPTPRQRQVPKWVEVCGQESGTIVIWNRCDRLDNKRISTVCRKLRDNLGRMFRYFIWNGVTICVNDEPIRAVDPLFQQQMSVTSGATRYQDIWRCEMRCNPTDPKSATSTIEVEFTELPIQKWHGLSNKEKRSLGISNGAGVSIVREGREVDFGWFFMGGKRRENYDDWWRCEVRFHPDLDEAFGITHTKQQIRPQSYLLEALTPFMESMAKALNGRVRRGHTDIKVSEQPSQSLEILKNQDKKMTPLSGRKKVHVGDQGALNKLKTRHPVISESLDKGSPTDTKYHLLEENLDGAKFFSPLAKNGHVIALVNTEHPFYRLLLEKVRSGSIDNESLATRLELVLLAAARAEATFTKKSDLESIERFREEWSNSMSILLSAS